LSQFKAPVVGSRKPLKAAVEVAGDKVAARLGDDANTVPARAIAQLQSLRLFMIDP